MPAAVAPAPVVAPAPTRTRRRGRTALIVALTILVTAGVAVPATLALTGAFTPAPLFDEVALEAGVQEVLQGSFGLTDARGVDCPADLEVKAGLQFECTFTAAGDDVSISVEVLNDEGQYRVGGPEEEPTEGTDKG